MMAEAITIAMIKIALSEVIRNTSWLALCVYREARSEPFVDQIAVCQVVMNRVDSEMISAEEVIKRPYQFSWLNNPDSDHSINDFDALVKSYEAVNACQALRINGKNLYGAKYFFTDDIPVPGWAKDMILVYRGKSLLFYKE